MQDWQIQFNNSEEGRARVKASRGYPLEVQADGSFTVDDVPPGSYELSAFLFDAPHDPADFTPGQHLGSAQKDVVVPEDHDTIEIGTVIVPISNQQARGN